MSYSMLKKNKLAMIRQKLHSKRSAKEPCIFHLSCPELDAIMGPPQPQPGVIIIHPINALALINKGLKMAKKVKDRKTQQKLKGHREHVQTILHTLEVHSKLERLTLQAVGGAKRVHWDIDA